MAKQRLETQGPAERGERVEAGHHYIRRRVLRLFDDLYNFAVLIGVTDAVPARLLVGHLFDEKRRVRACLRLTIHDVFEVRAEHVVPEHQHEVVVDLLFNRQQRVGEAVLFTLV